MPEICRFHGMSIKLLWRDHPPKHIHVIVEGKHVRVTFDGIILSGNLETDKYNMLKKWLEKRQDELNDRWEKAINEQPIERIMP